MAVTFTSIGIALGATGTTATVVGATVTLVATTALSYGVAKLTAPDLGDLQSQLGKGGRQINTKDPNAAIEIVYGTIRKGGVVTYQATTNWIIPGGGNNRVLRQVIVVAGHPVNTMTPTRVWIDDVEWEVNEYGYVTDQKFTGPGGTAETDNQWKYNSSTNRSFLFVGKHKGDQTSPDDLFEGLTALDGLSGSMTLNHKNVTGPLENNAITGKNATLADFVGYGLSYMYVEMVFDPEVFDSVPLITTVVQGKKVYDPEYGTTSFSNNPALCILDYLESEYGLDVDTSYTDRGSSGSFKLAADDCRVNSGSTPNNAFTCNGILFGGDSHQKNLEKLLSSCDGTLIFSGGKWKLFIGKDRSSTATTLTLDNLRGPIKVQTKASKSERFNEVGGDFVDSDNRWLRGSYPVVKSATFLSNDDGQVSRLELSLPMTTSYVVAQRLAKIQLFRSREEIVVNVRCDLTAIDLDVGDWVKLVIDRYGWTEAQNKYFEVKGYAMVFDEGAPQIDLILKEISAAVFDWDSEEADITSNNADPFSIANIVDSLDSLTAPSATASGYFLGDGTYQPTINLTWTGLDDIYVDGYQVRYYVTSDGISTATTVTLGRDATFYRVLTDGESEYTISLRAFSERTMGSYKTITQVSAKDTTAPGVPSISDIIKSDNKITVEFVPPSDQDVAHVDIFRVDDSRNIAASAGFGAMGSSPSGSGETVTDPSLRESPVTPDVNTEPSVSVDATPGRIGYAVFNNVDNERIHFFFLRSRDYSGNVSDWSSVVRSIPEEQFQRGATKGAPDVVNDPEYGGNGKIKVGLVVADSIEAGTITSDKLFATNLSGIFVDAGEITSGVLKGGSIPDADDVPENSETGAFLNLTQGKFVFGSAAHNILFDGTDLKINGDIITNLGGTSNNRIVYDGDIMDITGTLSSDEFTSGYTLAASTSTTLDRKLDSQTGDFYGYWDVRDSSGNSLTLTNLESIQDGDFLYFADGTILEQIKVEGSSRFRLEWSSDYYIEFSLGEFFRSFTPRYVRGKITVVTARSSTKDFADVSGVDADVITGRRYDYDPADSKGWILKNSGDVEAQAITAKEINQLYIHNHLATNIVIGTTTTLDQVTSGRDNIVIGDGAGGSTTTGSDNIYIGKEAGSQADGGADNNVIIGNETKFFGTGFTESAVIGYQAHGVGYRTVALGFQAKAGTYTDASTYTEADFSAAIGANSTVTADYGVAIGNYASASGELGVAIGYLSSATGDESVAIGRGSGASGDYTVAIGRNADANGANSIAIGRNVTVNDDYTISIGNGLYNSKVVFFDTLRITASATKYTFSHVSGATVTDLFSVDHSGNMTLAGTLTENGTP